MNEDLFERLKTMKECELLDYKGVAIQTNRGIFVVGVACMFFMLAFPSPVTLIPGAILTYILSNLSVGVATTIKEIKIQLQKFDK